MKGPLSMTMHACGALLLCMVAEAIQPPSPTPQAQTVFYAWKDSMCEIDGGWRWGTCFGSRAL